MNYISLHKSKKYLNEIPEEDINNCSSNNSFDMSLIRNSPFLDRPGKIKYAKMHASANRPMHKIREFSTKTNFCICCNLPIETKGIIEPFHFCDSIHRFSECGLGISLYFYFFRFSMICLIVVLILLALPLMIYNRYFSSQVSIACTKNAQKNDIEICKKYYVQTSFYNYTYRISIPFSSDSINAYLEYAKQTTGTDELAEETLVNYGILNLLCGITIIVMNIYFFIILKRTIYKEKFLNCSPSDFTLFISNLNNSIDLYNDYCISKKIFIENDEEKYKHFISFLKNKVISNKNKSNEIYDINICYNLKNFMNLEKQNHKINFQLIQIINNSEQKKLNKKYRFTEQNRRYFKTICCCFKKKGMNIKQLIKRKERNLNKLNYLLKNSKNLKKDNFAGALFLTFNTIQQKEQYYSIYPHYVFGKIIHHFKFMKYYLCWRCLKKKTKKDFLRRKDMEVLLAPEPEDIIWENIEYNLRFRLKQGVITNIITFLLLLLSFIIILALTYLREFLLNRNIFSEFIAKYSISLLITGAITGLNELFYYFLEKLTKKEKQISMTNFYLSFSVKLTIYTFISSGLVPLVCNYIKFGTRNENLVDDMLVFFICNSFITPLSWSFNITYIINKIRIKIIEKRKNPDKKHNMSQKQLNKLYQRPSMSVPYKYSYIAKTLLLSLFYISIFPLGIAISLFGFIFAYVIELYNFTHLYNRPEMINEEICLFYMEYFLINLVIFCLGILIFAKNFFLSNIWTIINLFILGILSFVPFNKFLNFKFLDIPNPFINEINQTKYEDLYFSFYNDYQRQNPMTKIDGLKKYINKLRINGFISEKVYKFAYMNIDDINVMELYYHSKRTRNILQTQKSIATYNNFGRKNNIAFSTSFNKRMSNGSKIKEKMPNESLFKNDEQLMSLLKNSIYRLNTGNFEELSNKLNSKKVVNRYDREILLKSNVEETFEELSDKEIKKKNKKLILNQYKYPVLLNINQTLGNSGDLNLIGLNENGKIKDSILYSFRKSNLNDIKEDPELNEDLIDSNESYKNKYFEEEESSDTIKSNIFPKNSKIKEKNIEMEDLSKNKNNINKKKKSEKNLKIEMKNINEYKEDASSYSSQIQSKNKKYKKIIDKNSRLKEYFIKSENIINGGIIDSNSSE